MMSRSVFWSVLAGSIVGFTVGCGESAPQVPPVMNAIDRQQSLSEAAETERIRNIVADASQQAPGETGDVEPLMNANVPNSGQFEVEFDTTVGKFSIEVNREWAPVGAHRFYQLVKDGFYDECGFFRVVPGFMVQFGLAADPALTAKWKREIPDDPVVKSNTRGYVTFAKTGAPNSRTAQVFINYGDNSRLDADQFAPFGRVTSGMDVVEKINAAHGEQPNQGAITSQGNSYLKGNFPQLDYVNTATLVVDDLVVDQTRPDDQVVEETDAPAETSPPQEQ
jgi:cyclophilin family peptidyl-prolyl cis-trans isomerase